ncbi:MAG: single-stranded DNA-binding protein [Fimbriimonadaceae bacterium]|nr:single-stranded DNA-binding protein [Fimbriimonadaceae bacterium]
MLNRIVLVGRLVADPEERHTNDGSVLSKFRIAVDRPRRRDRDKESDFFNVSCFGRSAEFVNRYLRRGDLVGVEGRLQIDDYTDKNDQRQRWVEVRADNVQSLGGRSDGGGRGDDRGDDRAPARDRDRDDDRGRSGGGGGGGGGGRGGRDWQHEPEPFEGDAADPRGAAPRARENGSPHDERPAPRDDAPSRDGRRQSFSPPGDDATFGDDDGDPFADH